MYPTLKTATTPATRTCCPKNRPARTNTSTARVPAACRLRPACATAAWRAHLAQLHPMGVRHLLATACSSSVQGPARPTKRRRRSRAQHSLQLRSATCPGGVHPLVRSCKHAGWRSLLTDTELRGESDVKAHGGLNLDAAARLAGVQAGLQQHALAGWCALRPRVLCQAHAAWLRGGSIRDCWWADSLTSLP